ncbi:MAG TPA: hypothetical protein VLW44_14245 [Streptosporangiaceae bacterium]|nr:hypothetical protein [Streptosporangiaceae bacterium]
MPSILRIESDPTTWTLPTPVGADQVPTSSEPVAFEVTDPLAGRLILSPRAVGSAVFLAPPPGGGHIPNGARLPEPCIYVPSATGPDLHSNPKRYYLLPPLADLAALEQQITAAMSGGTFVTIELTGPANTGVLVLNGAALSFVVLCPATPTPAP